VQEKDKAETTCPFPDNGKQYKLVYSHTQIPGHFSDTMALLPMLQSPMSCTLTV